MFSVVALAACNNEAKEQLATLAHTDSVRVDSLASSPKLPKEVDKHEFEAAKASLETMKTDWAAATAAFSEGNATEAADKARSVQGKVDEVKDQLAMNPT